ncbi:uncharacterized protein DS421_13g445560 [Arachis hypogaea]|nr:uncharacterized protein DS421_13g445560 [Arachis hypogaea]
MAALYCMRAEAELKYPENSLEERGRKDEKKWKPVVLISVVGVGGGGSGSGSGRSGCFGGEVQHGGAAGDTVPELRDGAGSGTVEGVL